MNLTRDAEDLVAALADGLLPDEHGRFGPFGGRDAPDDLAAALERLEEAARGALDGPDFQAEYSAELRGWAGRPTALTRCRGLGRVWNATVLVKREDLAHTGSHAVNTAIGHALLAKRIGARRVVADTARGRHGVAAAAACARVGLACDVYVGAAHLETCGPAAGRMRELGARVVAVTEARGTLEGAADAAIRAWAADIEGTYWLPGSGAGPHPYPWLTRELQMPVGVEARQQCVDLLGRLPDVVVAAVGRGEAVGLFAPFLADKVALLGIGAEGYEPDSPEHRLLRATGRASYEAATHADAIEAQRLLRRHEGIACALPSALALAGAQGYIRENGRCTVLIGITRPG